MTTMEIDLSPSKAKMVAKSAYNVMFPTGTEQEYFPILNFSSRDGGKASELDIIHQLLATDREDQKKNVSTVYCMSPPGLGKTVLGAYLARLYNCPYQILNCVSTMTDLDLLGCHVLVGQETVWQDGPLTSIVRAANEFGMGILIVNELNALTLNAQMALNPLLDKQECVVLTLNNNEVVKVHHDAHLLVIASMNPDILGVNDLQDSVRDRSNIILTIDYPSIQKEAEIVAKITGVPLESCLRYAEVINECRLLKTVDHKISKAPSTRGLIDWIRYSARMGIETAFELAIVNKYGTTPEECAAIQMVARGKAVYTIRLHPKPSSKTPSMPEPTKKVRVKDPVKYTVKPTPESKGSPSTKRAPKKPRTAKSAKPARAMVERKPAA